MAVWPRVVQKYDWRTENVSRIDSKAPGLPGYRRCEDRIEQDHASTPVGPSSETMFVVAVIRGMVVAALKLDIAKDPSFGKVGFIRYFEIEDELETTDLGKKMLKKSDEIAEDKGLRALDTMFDISRADLFDLHSESGFKEKRKEIHLRKDFRPGVFD